MLVHRLRDSFARVTVIWLVVWFIAGHDALVLNPVNAWAATLILAVALDLNRPSGLPRGERK